MDPLISLVGHTDLHLIERVVHVKVRQGKGVNAVRADDIPEGDQIQVAATSRPARCHAILAALLPDQIFQARIIGITELTGERTVSHPGTPTTRSI